MVTNNDNRVERTAYSMTDLGDIATLSHLFLSSHLENDDNDCRIDLPEGIFLPNLTLFSINGGCNWNADEIISWLASCCGKLRILCFRNLPKDQANQFMRSLQDNEAFIDVFQNKLELVSFNNCNLNEDDALMIYVNIIPLYRRLACIDLVNNNITSLETIGTTVRKTPPANNNSLLCCFLLKGNPFVGNLYDPESSDSATMICLLKYHQWLCQIDSYTDETIAYSPIIDYWLMMNRSGLRYLLDDGHGGTRLSGILPAVMNHAYEQRGQDPTAIFTLLRNGPIFRTHYQNNGVVVDDNNADSDDDDDDGDGDEYDLSLILRHLN